MRKIFTTEVPAYRGPPETIDDKERPRYTIYAEYMNATSTTTVATATDTKIIYDTEVEDTHNAVTQTGSETRFLAPATGHYDVAAGFAYASTDAFDAFDKIYIQASVNNTTNKMLNRISIEVGGTAHVYGVSGSRTIYLEVGDTLDFETYQDSGSELSGADSDLLSWFTIKLTQWN